MKATPDRLRIILGRGAPVFLALYFALWGLRGVGADNVVDTDAARHAMNGAFIHDWLASGNILRPVEFGKLYYTKLPALSIPYHPPLFPAIESLFFSIFGVSVLAARLLVAAAVFISVLLLYRLITVTGGSSVVAAAALATFCSWTYTQAVASDVMLEFPSLAFCAGALYCLGKSDGSFSVRRGILFALLAGAAVWTKQNAIFLGLTPFVYVVLSRRWSLLKQPAVWISSALFGAIVAGLWALTMQFGGAGATVHAAPTNEISEVVVNNLGYYFELLRHWLGTIPVWFVLAAFAISLPAASRRGMALLSAWVLAALLSLMAVGVYDSRYLVFVLPPLLAIAYATLLGLSSLVIGPSRAWIPVALSGAFYFFQGVRVPATFLSGPAECARFLAASDSRRILYCGEADGNFIFSLRALDSSLQRAVISGDKLPAETFQPDRFEQFARQHGIDHIVVEEIGKSWPYSGLAASPTRSMVLKREVPITSSMPRWKGRLLIYRFTSASAQPSRKIKIFVPKIGETITAEF